MMTKKIPAIAIANWTYFLMVALLYGFSILLIPVIGIGANLWINQLVWLLGLALFIAWIKGYSFSETFSSRKPKKGVLFFAAVIGLSIWFPAVFLYSLIDKLLTLSFGPLPDEAMTHDVFQTLLLVFGLIILAPLCEEFFFRGLMQKAYDGYNKNYSWLIVGVLFGVFHIGNGVSDILSATILGASMGYLLYVTNSIWPSVVLHAFANLAAVFLGQITIMLKDAESVPIWFVVIMLTGIMLAFFSVKIIENKYRVSHDADTAVADQPDVATERQTTINNHSRGMLNFLPLVLAAAIFAGFGAMEFRLRSNTVVSELVDSGHSKISIGKSAADSPIRLIDFELYDNKTYEFQWRNDYKAEYMHATFKLIGPDGLVYNSEGPVFGVAMSVSGGMQQSIISGEGQWQYVIYGELEGFEFDINWTLKRLPDEDE